MMGKTTISELLQNAPNIILQVTGQDLMDFAEDIMVNATSIARLELEKAQAQEQLLTIDEVCSMLKVSKMTLYRWAKTGILSKVEIGGKRRYRKCDVEQLSNSRQSSHGRG